MSNICSEQLLDPLASPLILSIVCHAITIFEFPLHVIGGYCILIKTPKRMEKVKRSMLIMHISIVAMNFIESFLVIPFVMVPAVAGVPLGLLDKLGVPKEIQLNLVVTGPAVAGISILAVFENRYFVLCDNPKWKIIRIPYIIFNYLTAICCFIYSSTQMQPLLSNNQVLEKYSCIFMKSSINLNSTIVSTAPPIIYGGPMLAQICLNFSQGVIILILTYRYFYTKGLKLSPSTYQMQKKFMKALLIQTILFTFFLGGPVSLITLSMFGGSYDQGLNNLAIMILSLNAIVSTIAMIYFHPPYRIWIIGVFGKSIKNSSNTTVTPSLAVSVV